MPRPRPPHLEGGVRAARLEELYEELADLGVHPGEDGRSIHLEDTRAVVSRIVEHARDFDVTILGASREGWFRKLVAGTIPERIAKRIPGRLLLVKHSRSPLQSWLLDIIDFFRDTRPLGTGAREGDGD